MKLIDLITMLENLVTQNTDKIVDVIKELNDLVFYLS